jgi:hypothetical protein
MSASGVAYEPALGDRNVNIVEFVFDIAKLTFACNVNLFTLYRRPGNSL